MEDRKKAGSGTNEWFLRTNNTDVLIDTIDKNGNLGYENAANQIATSPAMNLKISSVLFATDKKMNKSSTFGVTTNSSSKIWDLTIKGGTDFVATRTDDGTVENQITINVTNLGKNIDGSAVSANYYSQLSAMMVNEDGTVVAYGKIKDSATTGNVSITFPRTEKITTGNYQLKVFAEKVNSTQVEHSTDYASNMVSFDVRYVEPAGYTISYHCNGGTGNMQDDKVIIGEEFTLPQCSLIAPESMIFKTWAIGSADSEVTKAPGETYCPTENTTIYAVWETNYGANYSNPKKNKGVVTWDTIWFGNYPQSEITGSDLTSEITEATYDSNNEATVDGVKYRRMNAHDAVETSTEDDSYQWSDDTSYHYFKCEPIKWRILSIDGNDAFLLADIGMDSLRQSPYNWENSRLREWLNQNFIDRAFTLREQNAIYDTEVINKGQSYNYPEYESNDTIDKIYLLSYKESINSDYGFSTSYSEYDLARRINKSTYAFARGLSRRTEGMGQGCSSWWLRTPGSARDNVTYVLSAGNVYYNGYPVSHVHIPGIAIRPALHLNLAAANLYAYAGTVSSDGTKHEVEPDLPIVENNITFDANGGSGTMTTATVEEGEVYTLPECNFTAPEGKVFKHWAIGSANSTITKNPGETYTFDEDTTVYAVWEADESDWSYSDVTGGVEITNYSGSDTEVVVPATLGGKNVVSIGIQAFANKSTITKVTLPIGITKIGERAFDNCSRLEKINIPNSVTSIEQYAFCSCSRLEEINIPNSVTSIEQYAFCGCRKLKEVIIPNSIVNINNFVYKDCSDLNKLVIPDSVESIGIYAFNNCESLNEIEIPNSVKKIGIYAFSGCKGLTKIVIPNSVESIGDKSFNECIGLRSIVVDTENTVYDSRNNCNAIIKTSTNELIAGCKDTVIPNSVTSIGRSAFSENSSLTQIVIPNSVKSIGNSAFSSCSGLTEIVIPNGVISIESYAFLHCSNLTEIVIPNSITSIGYHAFDDCRKLTEIVIPNSVTSIGDGAFASCSRLTELVIPSSVTSIGNYVFASCTNLENIYLPGTLNSIKGNAFSGDTKLTNAYYDGRLEDWENVNIDSTGNEPLLNANLHTRVLATLDSNGGTGNMETLRAYDDEIITLPECTFTAPEGKVFKHWAIGSANSTTTKNPGETYTFSEDTTIYAVWEDIPSYKYENIEYKITDGALEIVGYDGAESNVIIPSTINGKTVTSIADDAFKNNTDVVTVTLPETVTYIGASAFEGCTNLVSVILLRNTKSISAAGGLKKVAGIRIMSASNVEEETGIGANAFKNCTSLKKMSIPTTITKVGTDAFSGCTSLEDVYYDGTKAQWNNISIASGNEPLTSAKLHLNATAEGEMEVSFITANESDLKVEGFQIRTNLQEENIAYRTVCKAPNKGATITAGGKTYTVADIGTIYVCDLANKSGQFDNDTINVDYTALDPENTVSGRQYKYVGVLKYNQSNITFGYNATGVSVLSTWNKADTAHTYYATTMQGMNNLIGNTLYVRAYIVATDGTIIYSENAAATSVAQIANYLYVNNYCNNIQSHNYLYNAILHNNLLRTNSNVYYRDEEIEYGWDRNLFSDITLLK